LRCEVELLEIREHSALLPQDWLQGKILMLRRCEDANDRQPGWTFTVHEGGNSWLSFLQMTPRDQKAHAHLSQVPIQLDADESARLIQQAMDMPREIPEDCVGWGSGFIDMQKCGVVIKDSRNGARCMVVQVVECGKNECLVGVHEDSPQFLHSAFYRTIERLIGPHVGYNQASA
jgi:hypothetical protein